MQRGFDLQKDVFRGSASVRMKSAGSELGHRQVEVKISSINLDRDGDTISQSGMRVDTYMTNPVVLFNHKYDMPIAKTVKLDRDEEGCWIAVAQFPEAGASPKSDEVFGLIKAGVLNTASVGIRIKDFKNTDTGWDITESELLEWSIVSVPANSDAQILRRSLEEAQKSREGAFTANAEHVEDADEDVGVEEKSTEAEIDVDSAELEKEKSDQERARRARQIKILKLKQGNL